MTNPEILLRQVPLFRLLHAADTDRLAALMRKQMLHKGDVLCRKGEKGDALYLITAGKLKIVRQSKNGDEVILALLSAGDFCGEMALLDGLPRSADAVAAEDAVIYALTRSNFFSCVASNERAMKTILSTLSRRLRMADDFLADVFFLNIGSRLAKKLLELASMNGAQEEARVIGLNVTQSVVAGMIGATRESVNKELRLLREEGLIDMRERKIVILDIDKLSIKLKS
jgi:CRP-like cAMP-binding protein